MTLEGNNKGNDIFRKILYYLQDDRGRDGGTNFSLRIQGTGIKPNLS